MLKLTTELVEFIPDDLEQGKIYVSLPFKCAIHLCACGCGLQTVTPFSPPNGWTLTLDENNLVTLHPSIGNFQYPCKSHYWIEKGEVNMLPPGT